MFRRLIAGLSTHLPSQCAVCHHWPARLLCEPCVSTFAQPHKRCHTCALPLEAASALCPQCLKTPPPLDECLAAVAYGYPWSTVIQAFKFREETGWARHLGLLMRSAPWVEPALDAADWVIPMPLSQKRLQERGFNQAQLLAQALEPAKIRSAAMLRVQHTPPQSTLHRNERLVSLGTAFAMAPQWQPQARGKRVVIVDDVMTTGASLHAVAACLRRAGASHITGLVLARTE